VGGFAERVTETQKKGRERLKKKIFFPFRPPSLISTIYFEIVSGLQKSYKNSIKNSKMPFTQIRKQRSEKATYQMGESIHRSYI